MQRWCLPPEPSGTFVAAMEDVLLVYARPPDAARPLICLDEVGKDLKKHTRPPQPAGPGRPAREDYEYARNGSANLFLWVAPHLGRRQITVTARRTAVAFAHIVRTLLEEHFPHAEGIVLVTDQLNIHSPAALYQSFPPAEARRLLERIEWHHTPTHASWLNMAELEISALQTQCLNRRLPDQATLEQETAAWVAARNAEQRTITWTFTVEEARTRLHRLYPPLD